MYPRVPLALLLCIAMNVHCTAAEPRQPIKSDDNSGASTLVVGQGDDAHQILDVVPSESVMERLEMVDLMGRNITYLAFTDTDTGGLVFVERKLLGTVSKHDALSFYSCRGYATTTQTHWARDADEWMVALLAATKPAASVTLNFSGKSTPLSIKEVVNSQALSQLTSLVDIGTNPLNILRKLNAANDSNREHQKYEKTLQALKGITPGAGEEKVIEVLKPEDVFFGVNGLVLAYPPFAFEYYVSSGKVKVAQQPSFYRLSRTRSVLFYAPNAQWDQCTARNWRSALPVIAPAADKGDKDNQGNKDTKAVNKE